MLFQRIATAGAAAALCTWAPTPTTAADTLRGSASAVDVTAPLIALLALVAWLLLAWLVGVALLASTARVPGLVGRIADAVARRLAPAAVRRLIESTLGLTVAVGVLGASPAIAADAVPPPPPAAVSLDWPSPPAPLDWNPAAPAAARPAPAEPPPSAVVVQPGDSLWAVAADHLPAGATDAQIAATWPSWWAANRDAVGADPDLITPGLRLTPPAQP